MRSVYRVLLGVLLVPCLQLGRAVQDRFCALCLTCNLGAPQASDAARLAALGAGATDGGDGMRRTWARTTFSFFWGSLGGGSRWM